MNVAEMLSLPCMITDLCHRGFQMLFFHQNTWKRERSACYRFNDSFYISYNCHKSRNQCKQQRCKIHTHTYTPLKHCGLECQVVHQSCCSLWSIRLEKRYSQLSQLPTVHLTSQIYITDVREQNKEQTMEDIGLDIQK